MTSLADIQNQDNCREKVISLQNFLQGPCFYGQRRLCLALCILSSLYVGEEQVLDLTNGKRRRSDPCRLKLVINLLLPSLTTL
jgi:hypothetical protein